MFQNQLSLSEQKKRSMEIDRIIRLLMIYKKDYGKSPSVLIVPEEMIAEGGILHGVDHSQVFDRIISSPAIEEPWYF